MDTVGEFVHVAGEAGFLYPRVPTLARMRLIGCLRDSPTVSPLGLPRAVGQHCTGSKGYGYEVPTPFVPDFIR
jgi:hypothetical protein